MNLVFGNLATLKNYVLQTAQVAGVDFDAVLATIGRGVAASIQRHCNRKFQRVEDDTFTQFADRPFAVLVRYPVEAVTKLELRSPGGDWVEQTGVTMQVNEETGIVTFGGAPGAREDMLRVTFTGGYFVETLEPDDEGYPTEQPDGSTAMPDDLRLAWLMQCQQVFVTGDKMNVGALKGDKAVIEPATFTPAVLDILRGHIRYA